MCMGEEGPFGGRESIRNLAEPFLVQMQIRSKHRKLINNNFDPDFICRLVCELHGEIRTFLDEIENSDDKRAIAMRIVCLKLIYRLSI